LFVENEEQELQTTDNRVWTPARRPYVIHSPLRTLTEGSACRELSPTSQMRAEIQTKTGHSFWAKHRQASEVVELDAAFNEYWGSDKREFTVPGQS